MRDLWNSLRRKIAALIAPQVREPSSFAYYPQLQSCQIPDLHFILERVFGQRSDGVFVEVGAYDGVFVSNTWGLATRGWRGYMVEPVASLAEACRANHAHHEHISIHVLAVGPPGKESINLYLGDTLTSASESTVELYKKIPWASHVTGAGVTEVRSMTLDSFLEEQQVAPGFELLVVDVEGYEPEVFSGFSISKWKPKVMIVELPDFHPDFVELSLPAARLYESLLSVGYRVAYKDRINTVLVATDYWGSVFVDDAP